MAQLKFSAGHVWVRVEGPDAVLGPSDYIQDQMGEITSLELPDIGALIRATRRMGKVEIEDVSSPIDFHLAHAARGADEVADVGQLIRATRRMGKVEIEDVSSIS